MRIHNLLFVCLLFMHSLVFNAELIVSGDDIAWSYIRNGEKYYLSEEGVAIPKEEVKGRFNVSLNHHFQHSSDCYSTTETTETAGTPSSLTTEPPEQIFSIRIVTWNGTYIGIREDGSIGPIDNPTTFQLRNINDTYFTLEPGSCEPLVTRNSRPPFYFYEKNVYPDEVIAFFQFEASPFDIFAIYNCTRGNTVPALEAIKTNPNIDKAEEYDKLVEAIESCGHFPGEEVFLVAAVIKEEVGAGSSSFQKFPSLVRSIVSNEDTNEEFFLLMTGEDSSYLHKLSGLPSSSSEAIGYGYDLPKPCHPFRFIRSNSSSYTTAWHIVYNDEQYLQASSVGSSTTRMMFKTNLPSTYTLRFLLEPNLETFSVSVRNYATTYIDYRYTCNATKCDLYAGSWDYSYEVIFYIEPYNFTFNDYYERSDIFVYMDLIRRRYSEGEEVEAGLAKLLELMGSKGHLAGNDIFTVASVIFLDFGEESDIFQSLPETVKVIVSGKPFRLNYKSTNGTLYPMKYSWASDQHLQIGNFSFSHNTFFGHLNMRLSAFALTYQSDYQIVVNYDTKQLVDVRNETKSYGFYPELTDSLDSFTLSYGTALNYYLYTNNTQPDFYFGRREPPQVVERAVFEVDFSGF